MARVFTAKYDNEHPCTCCNRQMLRGQRLTYIVAHADCIYPDQAGKTAEEIAEVRARKRAERRNDRERMRAVSGRGR